MGNRDENGAKVTLHIKLLNLYLRTYERRLRQREMGPELKLAKNLKNMLWDNISNIFKMQHSEIWNMSNLDQVLHKLKNN